ncbi:MAG: glycoside hydrolase family 25 protein [Oscillospiraceae bacterium]|nr:glycoside hydrolase family 25 protein [Oscillospiraceae bacterium]
MKKLGIDVSSHQKNIDWNKVKNNIEFAILRAGYGREVSQRDDFFEENYRKCKENNIPCGAYWYSYATTKQDALKEADVCLEVIKNKKFEYPIYFDIEDSSQSSLGREKISEISETFCKRLEEAGYWTGIYSYKSFLESNLTEEIRNRYAVWIAHTGVEKTNYSGQYGIWQFSHTGHIDGINGDVDCNYCYTDYLELVRTAGLNGYKKSDMDKQPEIIPKKSKNITLTVDGITYSGVLTEI